MYIDILATTLVTEDTTERIELREILRGGDSLREIG